MPEKRPGRDHEVGANPENPSGSIEELKQIVDEQERERERPMQEAAQEDIHTEKIIRQMESSDSPHKNEGTDPVEDNLEQKSKQMSDDEVVKYVAENKKELFALRKVVNAMHPKYRIVLDTFDFHGHHGGIFAELKAAGADVELDEESEMPNDVKTEQYNQLADEAFAIIKQKLGIERADAEKMLLVFHEF